MWQLRKHTVLSIPGLTLVLLALAYGIAFLAYIGVSTKRNRLVHGNDFTDMWITLLGLLLCLQALFVISAYRSVNRYLYWTVPWMAYGSVMSVFALCVLGGYASVHDASAAVWAVFWLVASVAIVVYAGKARRGYMVDRIMGIPEYHPRLADSRGTVLLFVAMDNMFPWLTWLVGLFFGILVVVQALCLANDHRLYGVPGRLVPVQTHNGDYWFDLHVWCQGYDSAAVQGSTTPVFILLADFGMPSTSMIGLAQGFADAGHPACIVDRPGYGWSAPGYWNQDPVDVVKSINQALTKYPIANPLVLVGWGEGGVWAQMYMQAADYSRVIGVVLLDTYPNEEILQTFALNRTTTLQNLRQLRSATVSNSSGSTTLPQVHFDAALERSASRLFSDWRAVSPIALHRARNSAWPGFQPQTALNMHRAMFRNNLYYQAKYFEYGGTGAKLYQGLLGYVASNTDAVLVYHHWPLRWPAFRQESGTAFSSAQLRRRDGAPTAPASNSQIPVLVVASAKQFDSDCATQGIGNSEECTMWQAFAWFYYRQQIEYQQTLSQNAALLLCQGKVAEDNTDCDVGFVWRRPKWLAQAIVSQLISQPAAGSTSSAQESASSAQESASSAQESASSEQSTSSKETASSAEESAASAAESSAAPTEDSSAAESQPSAPSAETSTSS
ncbi:hypothetical protein GGI15_002198 [Coemansia interrupta]|uniref:AB hydrolase-1 domain-containing protein n=1 Tax=Coemansia interrupta TaxID=1126814 RepID=A0A9W8HGE4_9FUNG|nr:hypothetical protein GGI15_002198 [Coemansia interrupta]